MAASDTSTNPAPVPGVYPFSDAGDAIEICRAEGTVDGTSIGEVRVFMPTRRDTHVRWSAAGIGAMSLFEVSALSIEHPELGCVDVPITRLGNDWGTLHPVEIGTGSELARAIVHWVNLPEVLPGAPLSHDGSIWRGRWELETCGWKLTIDSRRDLGQVIRSAAEDDEEFLLTHVGQVRRSGGLTFNKGALEDMLFGWQLAMSFALGRWVAPALPNGFDSNGRRIWERWAPWRCDTIRGYESWWNTHSDTDLSEFVDLFFKAFSDPVEHPVVRHVAMHVISANHSGTTGEGKVILAQAGLEYLSWVDFVLSGRMTKKEYKLGMTAADRLRLMLDEAGIGTAVPKGLDGLHEFATAEAIDGPEAVTRVRNKLVHPKDPKEPYRIKLLVWQAAQLLMEYGELLLLHRLGYQGGFRRRYPPGRWVGTGEAVPWAAANSEP